MKARLARFGILGILCALGCAAVADAQTTIHSIPVEAPWDVRSLCDVDLDGVADIAVGSPINIDLLCSGGIGKVRVFSGRTGQLLYTAVSPTIPAPSASFGYSIDALGDVNGDGIPDFVVGDPVRSCNRGAAHICSGLDGAVLTTVTSPTVPISQERFGISVAGLGDTNGDGVPDFAVGCERGVNLFGIESGYVCVHSGLDGSLIRTLWGTWQLERMGVSVAAAGDVNGDGAADILVGSPFASFGGGCGAVRIYSGADGLLLSFWTASSECVGAGVASLGDINGDDVAEILTGVAFINGQSALVMNGATGQTMYTVSAHPLKPYPSPVLNLKPRALAVLGDLDNDGIQDFATTLYTSVQVYSGSTGAVLATHGVSGVDGSWVSSVSPASDLNQDGHPDMLLTAWGWGTLPVEAVLWNTPLPATYCTPKLNSAGCLPSISSTGVLSLSVGPDNFQVRAANILNNANGMLLWGTQPNSTPFFGGVLCVAPPVFRTGLQNAGGSPTGINCTGSFNFPFTRAYANAQGVLPGTRIYAQYWSRDQGYSPPNNVSLTNGLSFTVHP